MSDPLRTCVGCRRVAPQQHLMRFRRRSDGAIRVAVGTRGRGRSAYLCPQRTCFQRAEKRGSLGASLRSAGRTVGRTIAESEALWNDVCAAVEGELALLRRTGGATPSVDRIRALEQMRATLLASPGGA